MSLEETSVVLSRDELGFLQFVSNLSPEPESPFARLPVPSRADETRAGREALITRNLVDPRSLRPNRDLQRRLLVVSEPDAHVRLESIVGGDQTLLLDVYERAGALVRVARDSAGHKLWPAEEAVRLSEVVTRSLPVRRSSGDFARLELAAEEYLAFCLLAARADPERRRSPGEAEISPRLSRGIDGLVAKDLAVRRADQAQLRPFLDDLGRALANRSRLHLCRTDFGLSEWLIRDVTFIAVPGSVFQLHVAPRTGVIIAELNGEGLEHVLRKTLEAPVPGDEAELTA
jgi:hypothetical protein